MIKGTITIALILIICLIGCAIVSAIEGKWLVFTSNLIWIIIAGFDAIIIFRWYITRKLLDEVNKANTELAARAVELSKQVEKLSTSEKELRNQLKKANKIVGYYKAKQNKTSLK